MGLVVGLGLGELAGASGEAARVVRHGRHDRAHVSAVVRLVADRSAMMGTSRLPRGSFRRFALMLSVALVLVGLTLSVPQANGSPTIAWAAIALVSIFIALFACVLWLAFDATRSQLERRRALRRAETYDRIRRDAETRARVAGELHDSVGHDLTAIIALVEGARAAGQGAGEVLDRVSELARAGLADTRRAVAALEAPEGTATVPERSWGQIARLPERAHAAGIAAPFSETGRRPTDGVQSELAYLVVREGITNMLRHAQDAGCVVISVDHRADGCCAVAVRDDGSCGDRAGEGSRPAGKDAGTGLRRLKERLVALGGSLSWGPDEGGWSLEALIPPAKDQLCGDEIQPCQDGGQPCQDESA